MHPNINYVDGVIRLILACFIGAIGAVFSSPVGFLALYFVITSLTAFDPIYKMRGIYTCDENPYHHKEKTTDKPKTSKGNFEVNMG